MLLPLSKQNAIGDVFAPLVLIFTAIAISAFAKSIWKSCPSDRVVVLHSFCIGINHTAQYKAAKDWALDLKFLFLYVSHYRLYDSRKWMLKVLIMWINNYVTSSLMRHFKKILTIYREDRYNPFIQYRTSSLALVSQGYLASDGIL